MTFDKLIKEYWKSPGYKLLAPKSKSIYDGYAYKLAKRFGDRDISTLRRSDMIKMLNDHSDKPAAANLLLRVASVMLSYALDMDEIPYNPCARLNKLKIGSHERWYPEEVRKAIATGDRIVAAATALAWYTGQREGDILGLQWKDFRGGYLNLIQAKTKAEMGIRCHVDMMVYLENLRGNEPDHYFIVSGAKSISGQAFRGRFARAMEKIGIKKTFHGIRKGVASALAESGSSTSEIAAILGHKTTRMAEYYAKQASAKKMASSAVDNITGCM
jgi:integrase